MPEPGRDPGCRPERGDEVPVEPSADDLWEGLIRGGVMEVDSVE